MSKKHKKHHVSEKSASEDKPGLKLVLKVSTPDQGDQTPPQPEKHGEEKRHKHKKKKKKHKHHKDDPERNQERKEKSKKKSEKLKAMDVSDVEGDGEPPLKKRAIAEDEIDVITPPGGRNLRERKAVPDEHTPLQRSLDYINKMLARKDVNGFFAYPVTDNIAPSYSKIIQTPMDFSTITDKIEDNEYPTILEYKADFKLMCDNCMKYNHPETIYYREAEKMLKSGLRAMAKDKLILMKRNIPFMSIVSDHEFGIDMEQAPDGSTVPGGAVPKATTPKHKIKKPALTKFEAFPDRLTPEQILAQAQDAAKEAAETLTLRKPNTKFGFLRRRDDGSTSLNLLNSDNDGIVSEKERVVNLGTLVGKLTAGTGMVAGFKEDKRNKALPVHYMNYGPFSSYAPVYDSSQANLDKEDSDLLITAYGDDAGTQYAYSIRHFVSDAGDYAIRMVDNLLDIITGGDHSKALKVLQQVEDSQRDPLQEDTEAPPGVVKTELDEQTSHDDTAITDQDPSVTEQTTDVNDATRIDFNSLRSLADLGIDVGFVDAFEKDIESEQELQDKLDSTSCLLKDLQKTQYARLSQPLPDHLDHVTDPDQKEYQLAHKVTQELTDLVKQTAPADVSGMEAIRNALGVTLDPENDPQMQVMNDLVSNEGTTVAAADTTTEDIDVDDASKSIEGSTEAPQQSVEGSTEAPQQSVEGSTEGSSSNQATTSDIPDSSDILLSQGNDFESEMKDFMEQGAAMDSFGLAELSARMDTGIGDMDITSSPSGVS